MVVQTFPGKLVMCTSTDTKPSGNEWLGYLLLEYDTYLWYRHDGSAWQPAISPRISVQPTGPVQITGYGSNSQILTVYQATTSEWGEILWKLTNTTPSAVTCASIQVGFDDDTPSSESTFMEHWIFSAGDWYLAFDTWPNVMSIYLPVTLYTPAQSSSAEVLLIANVDDADSTFKIKNNISTDGKYEPTIQAAQSDGDSTLSALVLDLSVDPSDDTGVEPILTINVRQSDNTDVTSRDAIKLYNNGSFRWSIQYDGTMWMGNDIQMGSHDILDGGHIYMNSTKNLHFGTTTGTKIGTSTSEKLAFWNATPIVQPTGIAAINTGTVDSAWGATEATVVNDIRTKLDSLINKLETIGLLAVA